MACQILLLCKVGRLKPVKLERAEIRASCFSRTSILSATWHACIARRKTKLLFSQIHNVFRMWVLQVALKDGKDMFIEGCSIERWKLSTQYVKLDWFVQSIEPHSKFLFSSPCFCPRQRKLWAISILWLNTFSDINGLRIGTRYHERNNRIVLLHCWCCAERGVSHSLQKWLLVVCK